MNKESCLQRHETELGWPRKLLPILYTYITSAWNVVFLGNSLFARELVAWIESRIVTIGVIFRPC